MSISRRSFFGAALALPRGVFGAQDRIDSVTAYSGALLPARPGAAKLPYGPFAQLTGAILVRIQTASGLTGYGLGEDGAAVYIIERHLRDVLTGVHPANIEAVWQQLYDATAFYGRRGLAVMAISGVDLALWDLAGKASRKPVCALLSESPKNRVAAYFTGNDLEWGVEQGFRGFKLPVSETPAGGPEGIERMVARVAEARKIIGPDALLMLDCMGRWNVSYTLEMARRLAEYRVHWIEEPLMPDDMDGYARLCREVRGTLITSGEHEYTRYGFAELLRRKAVQVAQPDISWSGGLTALREIAALARAESVPVVPHRGGSAYGLHFVAGTPGCDLAESFGLGEQGTELMRAMTPRFERGYLYPSEGPGFGVQIEDRWLARLPRY